MTTSQEIKIDPLLPPEMAAKAEMVGINKANASILTTFILAILAGAYIALGAIFATAVATGAAGVLPYGITRILMGLAFSLGLILVVVGGAELFTGNNLIIMAWASKKISTLAVIRNWGIVYFGNLIGSIATAVLMFFSRQYRFNGGEFGKTVLNISIVKVNLGFSEAIFLGIMCNALVCLAVWLCYSARSITDKILSIVFPISAFVTAGFEHSVANMYFIAIGLFIKDLDPAYIASTGLDLTNLTWLNYFVKNLLPVTIGNIIGGAIMVGVVYWIVYLGNNRSK